MSGGMDIDWDRIEKTEKAAEDKFGHLSVEEINDLSSEYIGRIKELKNIKNNIDNRISTLEKDMDYLWAVYKHKKKV